MQICLMTSCMPGEAGWLFLADDSCTGSSDDLLAIQAQPGAMQPLDAASQTIVHLQDIKAIRPDVPQVGDTDPASLINLVVGQRCMLACFIACSAVLMQQACKTACGRLPLHTISRFCSCALTDKDAHQAPPACMQSVPKIEGPSCLHHCNTIGSMYAGSATCCDAVKLWRFYLQPGWTGPC